MLTSQVVTRENHIAISIDEIHKFISNHVKFVNQTNKNIENNIIFKNHILIEFKNFIFFLKVKKLIDEIAAKVYDICQIIYWYCSNFTKEYIAILVKIKLEDSW